jgi:GNAT superfamily N-acetyltransferase
MSEKDMPRLYLAMAAQRADESDASTAASDRLEAPPSGCQTPWVPVSHRDPTLIIVDPSSELGQQALRSYWEGIVGRYWRRPATAAEIDAVLRAEPSNDLILPFGLLVAAVGDGEPVGCGGVKFLPDGIAELTRIHVAAPLRRRGLGARIVARTLSVRPPIMEGFVCG